MHVVVVGGGVAGVTCAEEVARLSPTARVTLVSASSVLKGITSRVRLTARLEELDVVERWVDRVRLPPPPDAHAPPAAATFTAQAAGGACANAPQH